MILRAQAGDVSAFEELVRLYDRRVLSVALVYTQNSEDAKDIYQEVFLRVHRSLPRFQFRSKFSTWLYRVVTNVCLTERGRNKDHLSRSIDERDSEEPGRTLEQTLIANDDTDRNFMSSEISDQIRAALGDLSPQQRMVFVLRHYEGHKLREIAAILDCAEGTVKKYLFTATERMRRRLAPVYRAGVA